MAKKGSFCKMRRPCNKCDLYFMPSTKGCRICDNCKVAYSKALLDKNKKAREKKKKKKGK